LRVWRRCRPSHRLVVLLPSCQRYSPGASERWTHSN
jgi:hypothetical protein